MWNEKKRGSTRFIAPPYKGIPDRAADDPISQEIINLCATARQDDDQLHYYISIIEQIHSMDDETYKIARYYSLLEAMSGGIRSQFEKQSSGKPVTRAAVRFLTGYFIDFDVPRFTLDPEGDFEFDHIELAGRIRDKLFHGGGHLTQADITKALEPGLRLYQLKPAMISHRLRRDCEQQIAFWARRESRGWLAQNGTPYNIPLRNPDYDGRELIKPLVTSKTNIHAPIVSVNSKIQGNDGAILRLQLSGFKILPDKGLPT